MDEEGHPFLGVVVGFVAFGVFGWFFSTFDGVSDEAAGGFALTIAFALGAAIFYDAW